MAAAVFFTGCNTGVEPNTMRSTNVTVYTGDWEKVVDEKGWNGYLQVDVRINAITRSVCNNGAVMVYLVNGSLQEMIPSVLWIDDWNGNIYGQAISCAFEPGWIRFYYNTSDFEYPSNEPNTLYFRVVTIE